MYSTKVALLCSTSDFDNAHTGHTDHMRSTLLDVVAVHTLTWTRVMFVCTLCQWKRKSMHEWVRHAVGYMLPVHLQVWTHWAEISGDHLISVILANIMLCYYYQGNLKAFQVMWEGRGITIKAGSLMTMIMPMNNVGSYGSRHSKINLFRRRPQRNTAVGLASKCERPSSKSRTFLARLCMRPTITADLWFTYEWLLHVTFSATNLL